MNIRKVSEPSFFKHCSVTAEYISRTPQGALVETKGSEYRHARLTFLLFYMINVD